MRIIQFAKQLNNTELGKGGTHDTYVLIPTDAIIDDIFYEVNQPIEFEDYETGEIVTLRYTIGREKRIVGLGQYYRSKNMNAGDEIVFERRIGDSTNRFIVSVRKHDNTLVIQKTKNGFEVLTPEYLVLAEELSNNDENGFRLLFQESIRKRNDSPEETSIYSVTIGNRNIVEDFSAKEIGMIDLSTNVFSVQKLYGYKKYILEA